MIGVVLVWTLCCSCPGVCVLAEADELDVNQPTADLVQHLESVVEPALFKSVPFQTVEQILHSTRCPVSEVVAGVPCCLTLYLLKQLGVFLLVGVPDS